MADARVVKILRDVAQKDMQACRFDASKSLTIPNTKQGTVVLQFDAGHNRFTLQTVEATLLFSGEADAMENYLIESVYQVVIVKSSDKKKPRVS